MKEERGKEGMSQGEKEATSSAPKIGREKGILRKENIVTTQTGKEVWSTNVKAGVVWNWWAGLARQDMTSLSHSGFERTALALFGLTPTRACPRCM